MRILGLLLASLIGLDSAYGREGNLETVQNTSAPPHGLHYDTSVTLSSEKPGMWAGNEGEGLRKGAWEFEGTVGAGFGLRNQTKRAHHLAFAEFRVGEVVTDILGSGHWYAGNLEILGELFVGSQFNPDVRYFVGVAPVIRYNFITGTRWVPFMDASAGFAATAIGRPDLGSNFEFDLQGGPGVKYFFRDNASFICQCRFIHFSNAGLFAHNHGINVVSLLLGTSWGF